MELGDSGEKELRILKYVRGDCMGKVGVADELIYICCQLHYNS